jgi:HK97 family phage portal protein
MGLLSRLERGPRASISGDLWKRILSGGGSASTAGVRVSEEAAAACSAVFSCVRVASEDIAKLPLILYRRLSDGGKERATDHSLYRILHDRPNSWQTSFEFRQLMQVHLEFWGNAYAFINRVRGEVRELIPLHPDRVTVKQRGDWELEYDVRGDRVRSASEILHIPGLSMDSPEGVALRKIAREAIGLAIATERHGARLFANGAKASGALKHPGSLSDEAAKRLKDSVEQAISGENVHRILLLEEGMDWTQLTMTSEHAQFLETRKFQVSEIARYFRMPPHKIADLERATFSNIEHQALEYVTDSLMPRQVRWEQRIGLQLLDEREREEYFAEFLVDALLRGDTKTRYEAHQIALLNGIKSRNEVRTQENLNPVPGGDEYRVPLNTGPAGSTAEE